MSFACQIELSALLQMHPKMGIARKLHGFTNSTRARWSTAYTMQHSSLHDLHGASYATHALPYAHLPDIPTWCKRATLGLRP